MNWAVPLTQIIPEVLNISWKFFIIFHAHFEYQRIILETAWFE